MAERKPVVLVGGQLQELPAGDTLPPQTPASHSHAISDVSGLDAALDAKQDELVSGTNIKTVNGSSLLGGGDLPITAGIADAPSDGKTYGRKDGAWVEGGGNGLSPGDVLTTARTLAAPDWLKCDGASYLRASYPAVEGLLPSQVADGITWAQRTLPASAGWYSVTYGNGVFVAVAYGSTIAATSPDGVTWTQRTLPASTNWFSVTYGNGVFVAVAYGSTIAASNSGDPTKFRVPLIADPALCRTYIKATI